MKENNVYKKNVAYFSRGEAMKFIGIGLLALAVILFFYGWGYLSYVLMSVSFVAGLVLLLINSLGRSSEEDIDVFIENKMRGLEAKELYEKSFIKRQSKRLAVYRSEGYELTEGLMYKKGKNSSLRSTKYTEAVIYPLDTAILVCYRSISLLSDEMKEEQIEIPYSKIFSFRVESELCKMEFGKKLFDTRKHTLIIESEEAAPIYLPIKESTLTDALVEGINKKISKAKEEKEAL